VTSKICKGLGLCCRCLFAAQAFNPAASAANIVTRDLEVGDFKKGGLGCEAYDKLVVEFGAAISKHVPCMLPCRCVCVVTMGQKRVHSNLQ
jgi:hypothetical protein